MKSNFRFFLICRGAKLGSDGNTTLRDILNDLKIDAGVSVRLVAVVGIVINSQLANMRLKVTHWKLGQDKKSKSSLDKYVELPESYTGPHILSLRFDLVFFAPGMYGFDLSDEDGAIAERGKLIARYSFYVSLN